MVLEKEDGWDRKRKSMVSFSDVQRYEKPLKESIISYKHVG